MNSHQIKRTEEEIQGKMTEYEYTPLTYEIYDDTAYDRAWYEVLHDIEIYVDIKDRYVHYITEYKDQFSLAAAHDPNAGWYDHYVTGVVDAFAWLLDISDDVHNQNKNTQPYSLLCKIMDVYEVIQRLGLD